MPLISIIIPAYNNASLLVRCLESITRQSFGDWEAVIVDDASTDDTSEVAQGKATADRRFSVVRKKVNTGLHLARKSGVEAASGSFLIFLDADDELNGEDTLESLAREAIHRPADIIRFGLAAQAEQGTADDTALAFSAWANKELVGAPSMDEVLKRTFSPSRRWELPWHVTHRLFKTELIKRAFSLMTEDRLDRAEDAYEYLVIASLARSERSCCDIMGYLYHMGAGVTNAHELTADRFARETEEIWKCSSAAADYALSTGDDNIVEYARGLRAKLLESMGNDLNERVSPADRVLAEKRFIEIVGPELAAIELWRFVRDKSWRYLVDDRIPEEDDELFREEAVARAVELSREAYRHLHNQNLAEGYLERLRSRMAQRKSPASIRIFASTHKRVAAFDSDIIQLIQVGAETASERFWETLHDDIGDNISGLNPYYCELTAQYWAWKNVNADYYGFCHYRRYFSFSRNRHPENPWGEVIDEAITGETQIKYGLNDDSIRAAIEGFDIITTEFQNLDRYPDSAGTPLAHWIEAPHLVDADLENMLAILLKRHPGYAQDVDEFVNGHRSCFCNMFIMRKQLFHDYCEWLFSLLDEFMATVDFSTYSKETRRTPGHLSERLFNIYFMHHMRLGANWRHREVQCVHFTNPGVQAPLAKLTEWNTDFKPVIPIVLAADDNYAPMLTTTIYSMLVNASPRFHYDVIVMTTDISADNQRIMREFLESVASATVRFLSVWHFIKDYDLKTNNPHIGIETYYRFLIQEALPIYDKVIYLDSDLIVKGDIAELFSVDLGDNLIAAVRDVDYLGMLNMENGMRYEYSKSVLGMDDPYSYFQAGVLVLNTRALREDIPVSEWLDMAKDNRYIYNDQDILNARCEGRTVFLDPAWNVMHNGWNRIGNVCCNAPVEVYDAYLEARNRELVIHYAGSQKPWNTYDCDRIVDYWTYARETPFYEQLLAQFSCKTKEMKLQEEGDDYQLVGDESFIRQIVDPILPPGSGRREAIRSLAKKVIKKPDAD